MPLIDEHMAFYFGPPQFNNGDDLSAPIVEFIGKAKPRQKLMIAVQELDHRPIAEAIIEARKRKVTIDLVLEQHYLLSDEIPGDPFAPTGKHEENRFLYNAILRATVDVKTDFNSDIFHQKFMVCGDSVLTGSTNFTTTGVTSNLNHVIVINDPEVAQSYKREFREIQQGRFGKNSLDRDEKPKDARVSGVRVRVLFAPDHSPEMEIMKQILKAKERIDFAIFTFSQSSGIDDALLAAVERGIKVKGFFDRRSANQKWAPTYNLRDAGADIQVAGGRGGIGKLHHKLMTIDDKICIYGSFNYTGPANKSNDENIIIIGDHKEESELARQLQHRIALYSRMEIDKIGEIASSPKRPGSN